jgi:hypothetical protein
MQSLEADLAGAFVDNVADTSAARENYAAARGTASVAFASQTGGNANAPSGLTFRDEPGTTSHPDERQKQKLASQNCTQGGKKCAVPPTVPREAPVFAKPTISKQQMQMLLPKRADEKAREHHEIQPEAKEVSTFSGYAVWAAKCLYNGTVGAVKEHFEWTHGAIARGYSEGREKLISREHKRMSTFKKALDYATAGATYPMQALTHGTALAADVINLGFLPKSIARQSLKHLAKEGLENAGEELAENAVKNAPRSGSAFDLNIARGTKQQMLDAVKRLDTADAAARLSADDVAGLTENARLVAKKYWDLKGSARTAQSVQNQLNRPRWRFLDQAPDAKKIIQEIIDDFGG